MVCRNSTGVTERLTMSFTAEKNGPTTVLDQEKKAAPIVLERRLRRVRKEKVSWIDG